MNFKFPILFFALLIPFLVLGQEATIKTKVSKNKLGVNQRLRVVISIDKQGGENFTPPSFQNFKIVGGPSQSVSQSITSTPSGRKVVFSQSYTYIIQPKRKGELSIGSASVKIGGKIIKSDPVKVIVLDAVEIPKDPNDPNYVAQQNIHLVAEISKSRPYVGEGVYVEYRLYVSENVSVYDTNVTEAPKYNGFWNQDIKISNYPVKMGKYNGEDYRYIVLQKALLIPTKTGKLSIDPMKMDIVIGVPSGRADFFGNVITKNVRREFASAKKIVSPKSLPTEGKPANFNGAVGNFKLDVALSKEVLKANETSQIKVAISGKGNLNLFELPKVTTPVELEMYQPERKEKVYVNTTGISGNVSDTYTVVPQYKGKYKIPSVSFSYFNPKQKKYNTITTKDFFVDVQEGKELVTVDTNSVRKREVVATGKNFRYIATKTTFKDSKTVDFYKSNWFYILLLFPLLAIPISIIIGKRNEARNSDVVGNKLRKANRLAKKYLSEAEKQLGKKDEFYEALERALHNYLKAKLGIETSEISKERITEMLAGKNVEPATISKFIEVLKSSDFARYTPFTATEMKAEYERAKEVIVQLDKQL
ncbi:BatD family protein [uncultured Polaribacter sp.]|uniref:BatD family protein n=1 Tax=uncultured Polaribacter sp. TaxID=174711 RepID=UPI00261BD9F1|nr:BatD family protein [uncultured Polaribacter sp.]